MKGNISSDVFNRLTDLASLELQEGEGEYLRNDAMSPLFLATVEAVEEALYNSLLKATTVTGRDGHTREALPVEELKKIIAGE